MRLAQLRDSVDALRRLWHALPLLREEISERLQWTPSWQDDVPETSAAPKRLSAGAPLRIVVVTPYQFYPVQHGGGTLVYHVLRQLATRGHEVSVVGFVDAQSWVEAAAPLREFCREVTLLVRPQRGLPIERLRVAPQGTVLFEQPELAGALAEVVARRDPDVVQIEYTQLASLVRPSVRHIRCITAHDIAFVSQHRRASAAREAAPWSSEYAEYLRTFHHEITSLRRFDVVFPVSAHDGEVLRPMLGPDVRVSDDNRTGIDVERFARVVRRPEPATLLFVGFFPHPPNTDAVLYFAREVLPLIRARDPEVRLTIVGADPPESVRRLADDPRVRVLGFVDDISEYYASATAMVAPIRQGAGVRIKILEAFASGVPVVSTPMGAEGLSVSNGAELLLAERPEQLAQATLALLADVDLQARLAAAARAFVQSYAWPTIVASMEREYRSALRRKGLMVE
ncbi:MAG: glycosyltransferase [Polyangiales bacterium]